MDEYKRTLMLCGTVLLGFFVLSISTCAKKSDFDSCYDRLNAAVAGNDNTEKVLFVTAACSGSPA